MSAAWNKTATGGMTLTATARARRSVMVFAAVLFVAVATVVLSSPASAHHDNRQPFNQQETNAKNLCGGQSVIQGASWITNQSNNPANQTGYYSTTVNVGATATTNVQVSIRGSTYGCESTSSGTTTYALNIQPQGANAWRMTSLASTSLNRGQTQGAHNWSTTGGQISARLDVTGLAMNNQTSEGQETITINMYKCFSTHPNNPTGGCSVEAVQVTIVRQSLAGLNFVLNVSTASNAFQVLPGDVISGGTLRFQVSLRNDSTGGTPYPPSDHQFTINHTPLYRQADGASGWMNAPDLNIDPVLNLGSTQTFNVDPSHQTLKATVPLDAEAGERYCMSFRISPRTGSSNGSGFPTWPSNSDWSNTGEHCVRVASQPYLRVYGGDVFSQRGIRTWNISSTSHDEYGAGGGAEFMVFANGNAGGGGGGGGGGATGEITGFTSGFLSMVSSTALKRLTLANTGTSGYFGTYGGGFNGPTVPDPDYYNLVTQAHTSGVNPNITYQSLTGSGPNNRATFGGASGITDKRVVYFDGDIIITNNITYGSGSWSLQSMPGFIMVARGNIYIANNVTQLDGLYIAQPKAGASYDKDEENTGGRIYTCTTSSATPFSTGGGQGAMYNQCGQKLTINGSFIANRIHYWRTNGSANNATLGEASTSSHIAEVIVYSPELFMLPTLTGINATGIYDAMTYMPPVI